MRPEAPEVLERPHGSAADRHSNARLLVAACSAYGISVSQPMKSAHFASLPARVTPWNYQNFLTLMAVQNLGGKFKHMC